MKKFIPFALPDIGSEEIAEVVDTLRNGWVTTGPKVKQFESDFSNFICDDTLLSIAVNSATAGLHLALEAIGVGPGDEVITTTHTFTATAEVIRYLGANPVFVDIDSSTLCMDLSLVEGAITAKTKAIIPVHFGGLAVDMNRLLLIARRHGLRVIEDAAHALPATLSGTTIGNFASDATIFSFYANKTITTGEGGMLVTRDAEIAKRAKTMRLHGISRDAFDRFTSNSPSWRYEVVAPGFKYNMTDLAASLGIHQLKKAWRFRERRTVIAALYNENFKNLPVVLPPTAMEADIHSWHLYVLRLGEDCVLTRDEAVDKLFSFGVGCSVHYIPLHLHPYWKNTYKLNQEMFPRSQKAYERSISLPIYSKMTDDDISRVIRTVLSVFDAKASI